MTLWLIFDDKIVESKDRKMEDFTDTINAMSGKKVAVKDETKMDDITKQIYLYAKAWENIVSKLKAKIDTDCKEVDEKIFTRLGQVMRQWIFYALKEASMTDEEKELREFEHYLDQRIVSIGMIPPAILLEMSTDTDRSALWKSDAMQKMVRLSAVIVAIGNELLSFPKDSQSDYVNLVSVYMKSRQCDVVEAHKAMAKINDDAIKEYDRLFSTFSTTEQHKLQKWAHYLRMCACGFSYWHTTSERYLKTQVIVNNDTYLKVTIGNEK